MKKILTGSNHSIWEVSTKDNGLNEQMLPLKCEKMFGRSKEKFDKYNIGGWDCDCGIYVLGKTADVEASFEVLFKWMSDKTNEELVNDLADEDGLVYMGLYKSKKQDLAVIIGGGYYQTTDNRLDKLLSTLKDVDYGEIGANYSDDNELYKYLYELVDYQVQDKEKINPMHLALLSEVFKYWEKEGIDTEEERLDMGYEHVDDAVKKFKKKSRI